MRRAGPAKPLKRDGVWYLVRRVPKEYEHLDKRRPVRVSTEIAVVDDPRGVRATEVVRQLDRDLLNYWKGLVDGSAAESRLRFHAAQKRARQLALPYRTAGELGEGPVDEILRRVALLIEKNAVDDEADVAAVLGGEARPALLLSQVVDAFADIKEFALKGMSAGQLHRWRLPKDRAVKNLTRVLEGDREAKSLTLTDALKFQNWLREQIRDGVLQVQSANKQIGIVDTMLRNVERRQRLGIQPVFRELRIEGATSGSRAPYARDFIATVFLAPATMDELNAEARAIVYLCINTGLRPAEAANLLPERIVLDHAVPHVQIRPDLRKLKTPWSARDVPLCGVSLWAMRQFPRGFTRYRDKEDVLSATVNKFFRDHGMKPTKDHTLYSFRHSFEDALIAVEAPQRVTDALMGHKIMAVVEGRKVDRPKYGEGPSLEQKQRWLRQIAFMPPGHYGPPA
jgi:integrase